MAALSQADRSRDAARPRPASDRRQLRHTQASKSTGLAAEAPALQNAFHANLVILAQSGRALLCRPYGRRDQRWPGKFGQLDKWKTCLRAARMPPIRSDNDATSTPDAQSSFQGEGGAGCHQGREDAGRAGTAV